MPLDQTDRLILRALEQDGRTGFSALAERVGLSKTPCWNRVQSLERTGVIKGYRAILDQISLGVSLNAFVQVVAAVDKHKAFEDAVASHPAILACYTTAGDGDYLLHVAVASVNGLDAFLRHDLSQLPGVQRCSTIVCLNTIKDNGPLTAAAMRMAVA